MTLNIQQEYPRFSDLNGSYLPIMEKIAEFVGARVNPYSIIRTTRATELGYRVRATSLSQRSILIDYLTEFPLLSSKRLDFLDWVEAHKLRITRSYKTT